MLQSASRSSLELNDHTGTWLLREATEAPVTTLKYLLHKLFAAELNEDALYIHLPSGFYLE